MTHYLHTTPDARKRLKRRYAAETRFRLIGFSALMIAFGFLLFFLVTIVRQATPAFFQHYLTLQITLPADEIDRANIGAADFDSILKRSLNAVLPEDLYGTEKRTLSKLVSSGASTLLRNDAMKHPEWVGRTISYEVPFDDNADLYFKGQLGEFRRLPAEGTLNIFATGGNIAVTSTSANDLLPEHTAPALLTDNDKSYFIVVNGGVIKLKELQGPQAIGTSLVPLPGASPVAQKGQWQLVTFDRPQAERKLSDISLVMLEELRTRHVVEKHISKEFFLLGASREAEMAGIWSALIGSLLTLFVTLLVSFPVSVAAAIYLEEFAPKTRFTELIEVNINNLAAVPSIIFGLLGLSVFLNVFGMPRSAPIVGGLVLALMTLPIIIIASRAALRSVPPSVKEAALGLGASHMQAVFHHVLPLAVPGILTGTILGTARALGETAPLLLIGMVAFVVEPPKGFFDAATLLPVQIFMWTDFPEIAFQQKTAAAILVMLVFLAVMNLSAMIMRRRFERRW
jgi:phosphate transport system permease protein